MTAETTTNPTPPPNDTTATLTPAIGGAAAMSVETRGKSLGDHVTTPGEDAWNAGKEFWKKDFG